MKRILLPFLIIFFLTGFVYAQEGVKLEDYEKCNNSSRHFCQSGNHEKAVNIELLRLKKTGAAIKTSTIRMMAMRIKPSTPVTPEK